MEPYVLNMALQYCLEYRWKLILSLETTQLLAALATLPQQKQKEPRGKAYISGLEGNRGFRISGSHQGTLSKRRW